MSLLFKLKSFNNKLFWKFFAKYFMLILIPAILASAFTNLFVVSLIQKEAEQSSYIVMKNNARQADASFHSLQVDMINLLSSSNMKSILKYAGKSQLNMEQTEMIYAMMTQVNSVITEPLVSGAFLYFANADLVIDNNIYTNKSFYFKNYYSLDESESSKLIAQFKGKQMMRFTDPYPANLRNNVLGDNQTRGSNVSVMMSYPFNSDNPEVYFEVHFQKEKLERLIQTQEKWISRTAIIHTDGSVISQSDTAELNLNS